MKVIKETRYVVQPKEGWLWNELLNLCVRWIVPYERKHFLLDVPEEGSCIGFSEVLCWDINVDTMSLYPDKYKSLQESGHEHYNRKEYYPFED